MPEFYDGRSVRIDDCEFGRRNDGDLQHASAIVEKENIQGRAYAQCVDGATAIEPESFPGRDVPAADEPGGTHPGALRALYARRDDAARRSVVDFHPTTASESPIAATKYGANAIGPCASPRLR